MVFEKKQLSKALAIALMVACAVAFMPLLNGQAFAAAKKPAKVKISSAKQVTDTMTAKVTWKKAKNAKKYNVKIDGKVVKKNLKKKTYVTGDLAEGAHKVQVQGVNGKKKGAWSKAKSFNIVTPTPTPAVEVKLNDASGLQTDGTALVGDTLAVSFGSDLGTPQTITWYCDAKVAAVYTGWTVNSGLEQPASGEGSWLVKVENTSGKIYTSNAIVVTSDQLAVKVSGFGIADDYDGPTLTYNKTDATAVASITLSKKVAGTVYIFNDNVTKYSVAGAYAYHTLAYTTAKKKAADMTAKNAQAGEIYMVNEDGSVTVMWKQTFTRDSSYKVVFSQEAVEATHIDTPKTDVAVTDPATAPYIAAPAKLTVTSAGTGAGGVEFVVQDAEGKTLEWLGASSTNIGSLGFVDAAIYNNTSYGTTGGTKVTGTAGINGKEGEFAGNGGSLTGDYFYVTAKTTAGVFGKEAISLTSDVKAKNTAIAGGASWEEDATVATSAVLKFTNVAASGTAYIYDTANTFDPDNAATYQGKATVAKGDASVTIENVFDGDCVGHYFKVVILPDDTTTYAKYEQLTAAELKEVLAGLEGTPTVTTTGRTWGSNHNASISITGLTAVNQFGEPVAAGKVNSLVVSAEAVNLTKTHTETVFTNYGQAPTISNVAEGATTITMAAAGGVDEGDGYTIKVPGLNYTITLAAKATQNDYEDNNPAPTDDFWTVK